jgi:hypothetical protein
MQNNKVVIQSLIDRGAQISQYLIRVKQNGTWATQTDVFCYDQCVKD